MSKTPEKNGAKAVVESWQAATGRWLVRDVETGETFLVKQANLPIFADEPFYIPSDVDQFHVQKRWVGDSTAPLYLVSLKGLLCLYGIPLAVGLVWLIDRQPQAQFASEHAATRRAAESSQLLIGGDEDEHTARDREVIRTRVRG